jgi:hypothetical protein
MTTILFFDGPPQNYAGCYACATDNKNLSSVFYTYQIFKKKKKGKEQKGSGITKYSRKIRNFSLHRK